MKIEILNGYWTVNGKKYGELNLQERRSLWYFIMSVEINQAA